MFGVVESTSADLRGGEYRVPVKRSCRHARVHGLYSVAPLPCAARVACGAIKYATGACAPACLQCAVHSRGAHTHCTQCTVQSPCLSDAHLCTLYPQCTVHAPCRPDANVRTLYCAQRTVRAGLVHACLMLTLMHTCHWANFLCYMCLGSGPVPWLPCMHTCLCCVALK